MLLPVNYSKKIVQKVKKKCLFASIHSKKWYNLTWPCNSPKFNLYHQQKKSTGFKMVVITPKLGMSIPLHTTFLLMKHFKSSNYWRKTQEWSQISLNGLCRTRVESKIIRSSIQASFPKLTILFEARSCDMYLLHSPTLKIILGSLQSIFR